MNGAEKSIRRDNGQEHCKNDIRHQPTDAKGTANSQSAEYFNLLNIKDKSNDNGELLPIKWHLTWNKTFSQERRCKASHTPGPKEDPLPQREEQSPIWEGGGSKTDLGTCHVTSRSRVTSRRSTPRARQETAPPPAADVPWCWGMSMKKSYLKTLPKTYLTSHSACLALGEWPHHHSYPGH